MRLQRLETAGLSTRAFNILHQAGYEYVEQVKGLSREDLICIRGMGAIPLKEIIGKLRMEEAG